VYDRTINPGSPQAVQAGCNCPVTDNHHGEGYLGKPGVFTINKSCPIPGSREVTDEEFEELFGDLPTGPY
jgi:hypothetical protein